MEEAKARTGKRVIGALLSGRSVGGRLPVTSGTPPAPAVLAAALASRGPQRERLCRCPTGAALDPSCCWPSGLQMAKLCPLKRPLSGLRREEATLFTWRRPAAGARGQPNAPASWMARAGRRPPVAGQELERARLRSSSTLCPPRKPSASEEEEKAGRFARP